MRFPLTVSLGLAFAIALIGCGGGSGESSGNEGDLPAGHGNVQVIENWVDTLRKGDTEGAANFFALPSVVENGTAPVVLHTRGQAVSFNESLPCGARLLHAYPAGIFINATFRLTDRPGGGCGSGVGLIARTAFVIRHGKIVQWRRLPNPPGQQAAPTGPVV
jgi:hypothetical protein